MVSARVVRFASLPALVTALVVASCTGDDAGIRRLPLEPSSSPGQVVVSPSAIALGWIGAQGRLRATVATLDGGSVSDLAYRWRSLNPDLVTVDAEGTVTAVQEGTARVEVRLLNLADTARVVVRRIPTSIRLSPDSVLITDVTTSVQLTATVVDGGGAALGAAEVRWSSSDPAVAQVSPTGLVTPGGSQGVATILAASGPVSGSVRVRVRIGPTDIRFEPPAVFLTALGDTARVTGVAVDARGEALAEVPVVFDPSEGPVVSVTPSGLLTAVDVGTRQIAALAGTLRRTFQVTVTQTPDAVNVIPTSVTLLPGSSQAFSAGVFDRNGNPIASAALTWTVADTAVARVTPTGVLTARAPGTTTLRATAGTVSDQVDVTVVDVTADSLELSPDAFVLDPGASRQVAARFFTAGVEVVGPVAVWSSDDAGVASVTASGLVRGIAQGSTWIRATLGSARDSVRVTVNAPPSQYDIVVQYVGDTAPDDAQRAAFAAAEFRWEGIVIGDLPPGTPTLTAGSCGVPHPAYSQPVDDLLIFVEITAIDGVNGVLASAGPCVSRTSGGLAIVGQMKMDVADLQRLASADRLTETVLHEMGHVLGFGLGMPWTDVLIGAGGSDPYFPGMQAVAQFDLLGGVAVNRVPVANSGGTGTRDAHWREGSMGRELMTGFLNGGVQNPLSAITIGALEDMGYTVDLTRGDPYTVSPTLRAGPSWSLASGERLEGPRFVLDPGNRIRPAPGR